MQVAGEREEASPCSAIAAAVAPQPLPFQPAACRHAGSKIHLD